MDLRSMSSCSVYTQKGWRSVDGELFGQMIRVGIVGCGFMGRMHANVYGVLESTTAVAAVDKDSDRRKAFSDQFSIQAFEDLDAMLGAKAIDAVDICLPTFLHKEYTVRAARAGKHIFCEKPMALTLDDADEMIEACASSKVSLMIGHCIRFWPEY